MRRLQKDAQGGLAAPGEVLKASERGVERTPDDIICFRTSFLCLMAHIVGRLAHSKPPDCRCDGTQTMHSFRTRLNSVRTLRTTPRRTKMDEYRHHVSGFSSHREEAEGAVDGLAELGVPRERLQLFDAGSGPTVAKPKG